MVKEYNYSYESIYDIIMALENIEWLIAEGKPLKALNNLRALRKGFEKTLYPHDPLDLLKSLKEGE